MDDGKWPEVSAGARNLIERMLTYDHKQRISAKEALQDHWFRKALPAEIDTNMMN